MDVAKSTAINGFSIDQRSGAMYVSLAEEDGSAIAFMPLPATPATSLGIVSNLLFKLKK